ncbi:beta-microseminoprotein-like [Megalops cyprinoides]|uniref:beta-microseminoprotein-like n=1 Tax=Megalops cyprinoides TaxID=118141 RepID=UPI00186458AD|nr:beta-microseminoprotein-like [Megalops cyprinoides]
MRFLIFITLSALALVALCHAQCFFKQLEITDINNPPKGCKDDDGVMRKFGESWVKDCYKCSCSDEGISCCNMIGGVVVAPPECEVVIDNKQCTMKLVMKADKTKECDINY